MARRTEQLIGLPHSAPTPRGSDFRGVVLGRLTSGGTPFTNGATSDVPWETRLINTEPNVAWDGSATLTLPPGYRFARVFAALLVNVTTTAICDLRLLKNGVQVQIADTQTGYFWFNPIAWGPMPYVPGDTLKVQATQTSGGAGGFGSAALDASYFGVELIR